MSELIENGDEAPAEVAALAPEVTSETAADTGENREEKTVSSEDESEKLRAAVARKAFHLREAERKTEALEQKLKDAEARIPQKTRPVIPGMPDSLELTDEEFRAKMLERDEAIREVAAFDAREAVSLERQEEVDQQQAEQAQKDLKAKIDGYVQNAHKLGVTDQELAQAGKIVELYGINAQVADHLLGSDQGPLITLYLSQNQLELDQLSTMDPMSAAVRIETLIKPKAAALKANVTQAPEPVETLSGAGVQPGQRGPKGATFE